MGKGGNFKISEWVGDQSAKQYTIQISGDLNFDFECKIFFQENRQKKSAPSEKPEIGHLMIFSDLNQMRK